MRHREETDTRRRYADDYREDREPRYSTRPPERRHWPVDGEGLAGGGIYGTRDFDQRRSDRAEWQRRRGYRYGRADNERFDNEDEDRRLPRNETSRLIASDKVEGAPVYDRRGQRIGTVENFMVTKRSGRVEYAVLSFGGFMGLGDDHYPLDWEQLTYDQDRDGYVVDVDESDLRAARRRD